MRNVAYEDLINRKFGYLTVIRLSQRDPLKWECKCDCGHTKIVLGSHLRFGNGKNNCGCMTKSIQADNMRKRLTGKKRPAFSDAHKQNLSKAHLGHIVVEETKTKLAKSARIQRQNQILKDGGCVQRGKHETELLDMIEQVEDIEIDRNFKCIGYFPDGYCHETNTIFEIFEPRHFRRQKEDNRRKEELIKELKCEFRIFYDEDAAKYFVKVK